MRPGTGLVVRQLLVAAAGVFLFLYERVDLLASELGSLAPVVVVTVTAATVGWQYRSDRDAHGQRVVALQGRPLAVVGVLALLALPLAGLTLWRAWLGVAVFSAVVGGLSLGLGLNRVAFGVLRPVPEGALPAAPGSTG